MISFTPNKLISNKHIQTILGVVINNKHSVFQRHLLTLKDKSKLALDFHFQKNKEKHPTAILVHGLTGSSKSSYVERMALKLINNNYNVVKFNLRSTQGTEFLSKKIYNAGQSNDLKEAVIFLKKKKLNNFFIIGFSLGGNLCLKFASENNMKYVKSIAVISPLTDLKENADYLDNEASQFYTHRFLKNLKNMIKIKSTHFPNSKLYSLEHFNEIKTLKDFDEAYQAPISGYKNAEEYYKKASAISKIKKIKIPTIIIHSKDDPLIPYNTLIENKVTKNKKITLILTEKGGHVGFLGNKTKNEDQFWAENRVIDFFQKYN